MSGFSNNIPSIQEIEESIRRSREIIEKSASLSRTGSVQSLKNLISNKCHVCSNGLCTKLPRSSHQSLKPMCLIPTPPPKNLTNTFAESLKHQNKLLSIENTRLLNKVQILIQENQYLNSKIPLSTPSQKKEITNRIIRIQSEMDKTDRKSKELQQKLSFLEESKSCMKKYHDKHCKRCISQY